MAKGKQLTKVFGGGKIAIKGNAAALAAAFDADAEKSGPRGGDNTYLNFSGKRGTYSLGRQKDDMDPEEFFAMDPKSATLGWVFWKSNKVTKRHRWALGQEGIAEEDLEDLDAPKDADGWKEERSFVAKSLIDGKQVEFSTSTVSARNSIEDINRDISEKLKTTPLEEDEMIHPIFTFDREEFTAQEQKNWKPMFPTHGWATTAELVAYENGDLELDDLLTEEEEEVEVIESKAKKKSSPKKAAPKKRRRAAL